MASFFIGRYADNEVAEIAGVQSIVALRHDIASLHEEIRRLRRTQEEAQNP